VDYTKTKRACQRFRRRLPLVLCYWSHGTKAKEGDGGDPFGRRCLRCLRFANGEEHFINPFLAVRCTVCQKPLLLSTAILKYFLWQSKGDLAAVLLRILPARSTTQTLCDHAVKGGSHY